MKVLVGVDGSQGGFGAVAFAGRLFTPQRDEVVLYFTPPDVTAGEVSPELRERARQAVAQAVFDEARSKLPEALRANVTTVVGTRPARQGLLLCAEDVRADLLVVGARGLGPISKLLLGSVSRAVVGAARIPVLVVRPREAESQRDKFRVLWACDGSDVSQQAGRLMSQIGWPSNTEGRVISVIESMTAGTIPAWLEKKARDADSEAMAQAWVSEHEAERKQQRDLLVGYCQGLPPAFRQTEPIVAEGHAAEEILRAAHEQAIDLVVLGAHGKGTLERILIGSTSEKVLGHATCSVLIVREKPRP